MKRQKYYPGMNRLPRSLLDLLALLTLVAFGWTVRHTRAGAADPTWTGVMERGELRVGTDPGFRPFAEEREGRWTGYDIDLANEIGRRIGVRVSFKAVSYDALYDSLAAGDVDLLAAALPLAPEQGWRARFSSAYLDAGQVLVVRTGSPIQSEPDLPGYVAGAALGSEGDTMLRGLQRQYPTIDVRSAFETPEEALAALRAGTLDAVITDAVSALGLTQRDRRFAIARGLSFEPYVLVMPVAAYQLQARVDRILDDLRREGFVERLNARWFGGQESPTR